MIDPHTISPKMEGGLGLILLSAPFWTNALHTISAIAGGIAAVCGAIVGIHAVWRLWKGPEL